MGVTLSDLTVLVGAITLRAMLCAHPHSGQGKPPMFGDYEAQRHWQEITVNLPVSDWYHNTTDNDLLYWGLDYPPLTAYHSFALGNIAKHLDGGESWVALHQSRGTEHEMHKLFMRATVLAADVVVLLPAVLAFAYSASQEPAKAMAAVLLFPGLILIDNGHFQYNNVSLGFFVLAVAYIVQHRHCMASLFFCLALNYKQMELYHALPFFFFLLGQCRKQSSFAGGFSKLLKIALTVVITFALIWLPFLLDLSNAKQVLIRLFPLSRGVFEDKVANFWCCINVVVKIKTLFDDSAMALICLAVTAILSLPTNLLLFARPTTENFLLSLVNTSLAFFFFSFQVHEKSILLVAIPVAMFMGSVDKSSHANSSVCHGKLVSVWFLTTATFSMFPLLLKDGLALPSVALTVFYLLLCAYLGYLQPVSTKEGSKPVPIPKPLGENFLLLQGFFVSLVGCAALVAASLAVPPPPSLPDLWPLLVSVYSAVHFIAFLVYFNYVQFRQALQAQPNQEKKKKQ